MGRREVLVQLDDDLVTRLDLLASERGTNRSELLRRGALAVLDAADMRRADDELQAAYRRIPQDPDVVQWPRSCRCDHAGVVARGDIVWADLGAPAGRRPVCILTRDAAIAVLSAITCAPITRTIEEFAPRSPWELTKGCRMRA